MTFHERSRCEPPFISFLILILIIGFGCSTPGTSPLFVLTEDLLLGGKDFDGPLAVGDLLWQGMPCDLGEEVALALPDLIHGFRPDLTVLSRRDLQTVLDSQKLQMKDLFQDRSPEPGNLLPAQSLLVGFFYPKGEEGMQLEARILSLESGEILSAAHTFFPGRQAKSLDPYGDLPLEMEFMVMAKVKREEGVKLLREGDRLCSGDLVRVRLKPNRPAYCYCFLLDSQGKANLLFPYRPDTSTRIEGGELLLPSSSEYFRLDTHPGRESIVVAASLRPMDRIDGLLAALSEKGAQASDLIKALEEQGRKGFVEVSFSEHKGNRLGEIMRTYTGMVWRKLDFEHLP